MKEERNIMSFKQFLNEEQEWSATVTYTHPEKGEVSERVTSKENIRNAVHEFVKKLPEGAKFQKVDYDL
jgi:hypothetical protein